VHMHSINPQLPGDMSYKRNQVEEAIARIFATDSKKARSQLRTRIKRLLELDRSMGRDLRSKDAEAANFGFFSQEAPGTGVDIAFSEYEGFAVLNGLRIMAHGWPQGFAVSIMRRVRPDLQREHERILMQPSYILFDQRTIRASARPGDIAVDNTDPVFLTLASTTPGTLEEGNPAPICAVCRGFDKATAFVRAVGASSMTTIEVATMAHRLHDQLMRTELRRRGRG
jgi:hypothetical protein